MRFTQFLLALAWLPSCAQAAPARGPVVATPETAEATFGDDDDARPVLFELPESELTLIQDGQADKVLHHNGLVVDRGQPVGKLLADGRFVDLDGREFTAMDEHGTIEIDDAVVTITDFGQLVVHEPGFDFGAELSDDGSVLQAMSFYPYARKAQASRRGMTIEGLTPELRKAALFLLFVPDMLRLRDDSARDGRSFGK